MMRMDSTAERKELESRATSAATVEPGSLPEQDPLRLTPIPEQQGVNARGSDITDLRRAAEAAERRAQEHQAHYANLLAHLDDGVMAVDQELRFTAWNRASERMFGWSEAEVLGRSIPEVLPTQFLDSSPAEVMRQVAAEGHWRGEMIITAKDGRLIHVEGTAVQVRDADGRVIGQVGVNRDITRRKAIEAQNARLVAELSASREELAALSRRLVAMQEAERSYVADQLHNQAGQVLAALQLQLARLGRGDAGEQLPAIQATLDAAMAELHTLATELRPFALDRSSLAGALRSYATEFGRAHGLAVRFDAGNAEFARPPADVATSLFRAVQEGLANVARHAQAREVALQMRLDGELLRITLTDDGVGFDPLAVALRGGLGLASIRERLKTVGGHLTVESGPAGSTLTFAAPIGEAVSVA
jgi:PAS domain S-box-containing protein